MTNYYKYESDFELPESCKIKNKYPSDIKRIISICDGSHTFHKRFYFFSASQRQVYKLNSNPLKYQTIGNSLKYTLVDDMNKRCSFSVSDFLIALTANQSRVALPKKYK